MEAAYGVAAWSSPAWIAGAVAWLDEQLAAAGRERTGAVEQTRVRPWSTLIRAPTAGGDVWFKAAGPATAFETALVPLLARLAPGEVLTPIAADPVRGWLLLPDGGEPLPADGFDAALARYGALQRGLAAHAGELLALGVPDMRPAVMPGRFREALDAVAAIASREDRPGDRELVARAAALEPEFADWCARLEGRGASLDHNDLHRWNVLGDGRFFDWGDAVVAHPFATLLVPVSLGADPGPYLDGFGDRAALREEAELARRVATIARVLTWERALRSAWEQGEALDERWTSAPAETLATLL